MEGTDLQSIVVLNITYVQKIKRHTLSRRCFQYICRRLEFFKMEPGHVFIIGSSVELCFLIEYMLQL